MAASDASVATQGMDKASAKKNKRPKWHVRKDGDNADLRQRAEQDRIPFDDRLPAHLIP